MAEPRTLPIRLQRGLWARLLGWDPLPTFLAWLAPPFALSLAGGATSDYRQGQGSGATVALLAMVAVLVTALWAAMVSRTATAWLEADEVGLRWRTWRRQPYRMPWSELTELRLTRVSTGSRGIAAGILAVDSLGDEYNLWPAVLAGARRRERWIDEVTAYRGLALPVIVDSAAAFAWVGVDAPTDGVPPELRNDGFDPARPLRQQNWAPGWRRVRRVAVIGGLALLVPVVVPFWMVARTTRLGHEFRDHGTMVTARVEQVINADTDHWPPIPAKIHIRFTTATGAEITTVVESTVSEVGPTIDVRYLPDAPTRVRAVHAPAPSTDGPTVFGTLMAAQWLLVAGVAIRPLLKLRRLACATRPMGRDEALAMRGAGALSDVPGDVGPDRNR